MTMDERTRESAEGGRWDFSDLGAPFINCTLKKSPEPSHTEGLMDASMRIMEANGIATESMGAIDHEIAPGVWPDMTEHGWDRDEWPQIFTKVEAAAILVLGSAIWLGEKTSVCTEVIDRLYGNSHILNDEGQHSHYGKAGDCLTTGKRGRCQAQRDEHPLLAPAPRLRDPAPGRRRLDRRGGPRSVLRGSRVGGPENDFTNRNTTFMTWNLMHLARIRATPAASPHASTSSTRVPLTKRLTALLRAGGTPGRAPGATIRRAKL